MTTVLPTRMSAAYLDRLGSADSIRCGTLPVPPCGPTDVLVQVESVAVNAVDTFVRSGAYPTPTPFPFVVGSRPGGRRRGRPGVGSGRRAVWSKSLGHAGRRDRRRVRRRRRGTALPLPPGVDPVAMAAVVHPATTAHLALDPRRLRLARLPSGGCRRARRQCRDRLHRAGASVVRPWATDLETCLDLGADVAIDYRDPDLASGSGPAPRRLVSTSTLQSGHHDLDAALDLLCPRGRIVVMAGMSQRPLLPAGTMYTRDAQISGFAISNASTDLAGAAAGSISWSLDGARREVEMPLSAAARRTGVSRADAAGRRLGPASADRATTRSRPA